MLCPPIKDTHASAGVSCTPGALQGDGFQALYRVGVPGEHRDLLNDHRVHRILNFFLRVPPHDGLYDPYTDCILLPSRAEIEAEMEAKRFRTKGAPLTTTVDASTSATTGSIAATSVAISTAGGTSSRVSSASGRALGTASSVSVTAGSAKSTRQPIPLCSDVDGDDDIVEVTLSTMPEMPRGKGP